MNALGIARGDKSLEAYRLFPYLAWLVTIFFALFVYSLALELRDVTRELKQQAAWIQVQIDNPATADFESEPSRN